MFEKITDWVASEQCVNVLSIVGISIGVIALGLAIILTIYYRI